MICLQEFTNFLLIKR